jgi:hypothetical protein
MSAVKTIPNDSNVEDFIATVQGEQKQKDSFELLAMFKKATGEKPRMWGTSIVGFGLYHFKSERSSQEGDWPFVGFSPRKQYLTLYVLPSVGSLDDLFDKLGKHTTSKACLYINKLADIDKAVLAKIIERAYQFERAHQEEKNNPQG